METEINISGISENLADSIVEQKELIKESVPKGILHGKQIAISVSESEELEELGLSVHHIKDISIEIARYLIVNGAKILYGGDLRRGGFTELFSDISYQYKFLNDKERKVVNFFPFPSARQLSTNDIANFLKKQVQPIKLQTPKHLGKPDPDKNYKPNENVDDRFLFAECFTDMRIHMSNESDARIVLGGIQKNFTGYFPGIVEETFYSLEAGKPVYLLGGFGGATKSIIEMILGNRPNQMTNEFQFDSEFLIAFREFSFGKTKVILDYDYLFNFFSRYNIEKISNLNGLSVEENQILFESINIHEIVFLIIKGLKNI